MTIYQRLSAWLQPKPVQIVERVAPKIEISATLLAMVGVPEQTQAIKPYEPPVGVIPTEKRKDAMAMDSTDYSYVNSIYCNGEAFKGYQYLAVLTQRPEYRKMSETIAKEMTRKWIKVVSRGDDDKSDRIKAINAALEKFKVRSTFNKAAELDGFYGRGQIYIDLNMPRGGGRVDENPDELSMRLIMDKSKITKGSLNGFKVVEPVWTYPSAYNSDNPLAPDYYKPTQWFVMGKTVHATRLMMFVSREVPDLLKASYNFGGLSLSQMAEPYVDHWLRTRDSISDMVHSFSINGLKMDMSAFLASGMNQQLINRIELFNKMRDNRNVFLIDKEKEEFFQFNTPLSGLHELQSQSQEQMASVCNIPLVKFTGITPSGLNASSDGEIRVFYDDIHARQEQLFRDNLERVIDIIQLNEFGEIDKDITFEFEPLYQLDGEALARVRKSDADTAQVLISEGVISAEEERVRLASDPNSGYTSLDVNDLPPEPENEEVE